MDKMPPGFASATTALCTRPAAMHSSSPVPATQLCAMQALSQRPSGPARALGRPAAGLRRPARPVGTLARAQRSSTEETPWEGAGAWRSLLGAAALSVILLKVGDSALARRPSELAAPWHSPPHHNSMASRCSALATGACRRRRRRHPAAFELWPPPELSPRQPRGRKCSIAAPCITLNWSCFQYLLAQAPPALADGGESRGGGSALLTALAAGGIGGAALVITRSLAKVTAQRRAVGALALQSSEDADTCGCRMGSSGPPSSCPAHCTPH